MKIKAIQFLKHPVFKSHTVVFGDGNLPIISFLVGNNGSGKTHVLETLYNVLTSPFSMNGDYELRVHILFSDKEKAELKINENEVVYLVQKGLSNNHSVKYASGGELTLDIQTISKIVFSTIEVNFNEQSFNSVTSRNIDDAEKPKERSRDLSNEIPQLLIDIKALDDAERGKWYEANRGKQVDVPDGVGTRIKRFADAFHKIYDGEKTFSDIKNEGGAKQITFVDRNGEEVRLNQLSTGEKQVIYRIGYILKNLGNIDGGIILMDEPEISLHPFWQMKLKEFLIELFIGYDVQIIIATHSPYIFKNLDETKEACIKIDRLVSESKKVSMIFPRVPYNPSVQLIGYIAYGIVDEMLHTELYTLLQIRERRTHIKNSHSGKNDGIEDWLRDPAGGNIPIHKSFIRTGHTSATDETIMTWIRNKIHHADEPARPVFAQADLKASIDELIRLLQA